MATAQGRLLFGAGLLVGLMASMQPAAAADPFPRPASLESAIELWKRVYTEVTTQGGLIHDSRHMGRVYEVLKFPEGASYAERRQRVRQAKRRYRGILRELAAGKRSGLSDAHRRVLAMWPDAADAGDFRAGARRLRFQLGQADKFRAGLERSGAWLPYIHDVLADLGLPRGLAALPHVESSFNPDARSSAGAAGMWQFTRSTGRRFMRIDHVVDERRDPFRSTRAAAQLLKHNYEVTGSWPLAITAYNHGVSGMRRAVARLGTDDIGEIVHRYRGRAFGFASRNFYAAFRAALEVDRHPERYFDGVRRRKPAERRTVRLPDFVPASALAQALGVSKSRLRAYNPALLPAVWRGSKHVPQGFALRLPPALAPEEARQALSGLPQGQRFAEQQPDTFHVVRWGETLSTIATRYDASIRELVALNGLGSRHRIRAGQRLRLPVDEGRSPGIANAANAANAGAPNAQPPASGRYVVEPGDTLWGVARRFGLKPARLVAANDLGNADLLKPGQALRIPGAAQSSPKAAQTDARVAQAEEGVAEAETPEPEPTRAAMAPAPPPLSLDPFQLTDASGMLPASPATSPSLAVLPVSHATGRDGNDLLADPSEYNVRGNDTIVVQAAETLGHYAEWLELRAWDLRRLNGMSYGTPVVVGERLRLNFANIDPERFERRRRRYHRQIQSEFFADHRITGTKLHVTGRGESLWRLAQGIYDVPLWLLRQYNPDLEASALKPGMEVTVPKVERRTMRVAGSSASPAADTAGP